MKGVLDLKENQNSIFILIQKNGTFLERHYALQLLCMSGSSLQPKDYHQSLTDMPECCQFGFLPTLSLFTIFRKEKIIISMQTGLEEQMDIHLLANQP